MIISRVNYLCLQKRNLILQKHNQDYDPINFKSDKPPFFTDTLLPAGADFDAGK